MNQGTVIALSWVAIGVVLAVLGLSILLAGIVWGLVLAGVVLILAGGVVEALPRQDALT